MAGVCHSVCVAGIIANVGMAGVINDMKVARIDDPVAMAKLRYCVLVSTNEAFLIGTKNPIWIQRVNRAPTSNEFASQIRQIES
jgi:hypothetical protein